MSAEEAKLTSAKYEEQQARKRLQATVGALQYRLKPATLVHNAVGTVREKSSDAADKSVRVAQNNAAPIAGVVAALVIFLTRKSIYNLLTGRKSTVKKQHPDSVTVTLDKPDRDFDLTAPVVSEPTTIKEGVLA